ncbi:MAG: GAF domain-containing sensor histidine kinase [Chloroflexi bacterium]|nr:GAF domain-containing sensor histidine kinase [Chloroflexota bacterium]MBI3734362.1 GAF domain-containing sensor histidine kinase [Chloroflexota bacterium]
MRIKLSTRGLRLFSVILPLAFWLIQLQLRSWLFAESRSLRGDLFALAMLGLGAALFSLWVFGIIDKREAEVRQRTEQLAALHDAALALTTELDLATVLQKVIDLSRGLANARYGALGVLDGQGRYIDQFITSGLSPEQRAQVGPPPRGHGLLGILIKQGEPIRIPDIARDDRSVGFPPNHPPMHSLLGVPITSKGKIIGDLYLTDKLPESDDDGPAYVAFSEHDQQVLEMFATQAAIAIENAQLYRQTQQLAILQERERFGMDLHDGIIQSIYAIGLMLEDGQHRLTDEPQAAAQRIAGAIHDLNGVIRDIRNYILDLRPQRFQGGDLPRGIEELARDLRANSFLAVNVRGDGFDSTRLAPEHAVEILHILQEALTNVRKHARATSVEVTLSQHNGQLRLSVDDNGIGFNPQDSPLSSGHGLRNMRERARALGGELHIEPRVGGGTRLTLSAPTD